jgi:hypothetical protein
MKIRFVVFQSAFSEAGTPCPSLFTIYTRFLGITPAPKWAKSVENA